LYNNKEVDKLTVPKLTK